MRYQTYTQHGEDYPICILVSQIRKDEIKKVYLDDFGIPQDDILLVGIHQKEGKKKTPVAEIKQFIEDELVGAFTDCGARYLLVADGDYFKVLSGKQEAVDANLGYVMDCVFGPWKVIYVPNYRSVFYDPVKIKSKIAQGMTALCSHVSGSYTDPGTGIIKTAHFPSSVDEIRDALQMLLDMQCPLTVDIEAFSLKHHTAGIGTITFCWNETEGVAFAVDYKDIAKTEDKHWGRFEKNEPVRALLRWFFETNTQTLIYHNIAYDVYVLIYQLYMNHLLDTENLLRGMDILLTNFEDTKLITYLATNSCSGNKLSLKDQAQEYAGNYAETEIEDIRLIPLPNLLRYNLVDGLSTWYVYKKHWDKLNQDDQRGTYEGLFKDAIKDIIQMQLTGMPLNMQRVMEIKAEMLDDYNIALNTIRSNPKIQEYTYILNEKWVEKRNNELKKKRVTLTDAKEVFNPNSDPQMQDLLFNFLGLPVLGLTDSKQPSSDGDTLKSLKNHTTDPDILSLLSAVLDFVSVEKILSSFIPPMENAARGPDGWHYLFGNFNLGGTVSGRLSSSKPNLQNIPANSKYAKLIKSAFQAPVGWIFAGLDFSSLEDRISALTTKDPNKLKVYTDGYDGHSLRAFSYFGDQMPGIVDTLASINSLSEKSSPYYYLRQESKAPTFALTYQGTYITLMKNCGFSETKAKLVEERYHIMYAVSDKWVADKLDQASQCGYITAAFGLRVRTPLLHQVIRNNSKTPYEAQAEGRTAGNALGQSWCLLNSRAASEFMGLVRKGEHRLDIRPCAHIHDAQYYLIRDDVGIVSYVNEHLVKAVEWQDHPDIEHPSVKLGGELSIFWPSWGNEIVIPNEAKEKEIVATIDKYLQKQ